VYFDSKRMSVHAPALVPLGYVRQKVRSLDLENSKKVHARIVTPGHAQRNSSRLCLLRD
jgi:hypothetical protein